MKLSYPLLTFVFLSTSLSPSLGFVVNVSPSLARKSTALSSAVPRRELFEGALGGALGGALLGAGAAKASTVLTKPLADLPMVRLKLPQAGLGREYVAVKLKIQGKGPFDFMVDSGLTTELITPHLQQSLGIATGRATKVGVGAGGGTSNPIVDLKGASLCCGDFAQDSELALPPLHAVITNFPQEHIDPAHDPVEGMLGMEMLSLFDVDFDFPKNRLRFWQPGTTDTEGLVEIPAVVINETGLIGIRLAAPGGKGAILGFIDCGSTFSAVNWAAADLLGLPPKGDPAYRTGKAVQAIGIDGNLLTLPLIKKPFTFAGDVVKDPATGRPVGLEPPPPEWKPWNAVQVAVGDLPAFSTALGDGITPYKGPAALIGLDILAQRRVILETGTGNTRRRRLLVAPR